MPSCHDLRRRVLAWSDDSSLNRKLAGVAKRECHGQRATRYERLTQTEQHQVISTWLEFDRDAGGHAQAFDLAHLRYAVFLRRYVDLDAFGRLYGVSKTEIKSRVDWALEWSDLKDRADEPTKQFSGGMKRRLNIACGLLHSPKIVLLDEPTVGVDPQSRDRIYEMLAALQRDGVSIVLTTHHLEEAERRCARILIIDHGRIVAEGPLAHLLEKTVGAGGTLQAAFIALTGRDLRE